MNSSQFAWAYLIENGWGGYAKSYYGGWIPINGEATVVSWDGVAQAEFKIGYVEKIESVGIDWSKTKSPRTYSKDVFTSTCGDDSSVEMVSGILVLKDGSTQTWNAEIRVSSIFDVMADASKLEARYAELLLT